MAILGVVLLIFIGGLASVRQGWRRITGKHVYRRSRTARWINASFFMIIGIGWLARTALNPLGMYGLSGSPLPEGYWLIVLAQSLPGLIFLLIGIGQTFQLLRDREGDR
jgi:hypothetical protein